MNHLQDQLQIPFIPQDQNDQLSKWPTLGLHSDGNSDSDQNQENKCLKVSTSTKPSIVFSSSNTFKERGLPFRNSVKLKTSTNQQNKVEKHESKCLSEDLRQLTANDEFSCQSCTHQVNSNCQVCNGKTKLNGNDKIIKFFEYLLEFKLGKKQSYKPKEQKKLSKKNTPNQHCNLYFSTINPKISEQVQPPHRVRFSMNCDFLRPDSGMQCEQKPKCRDIHIGFNCDHCHTEPIVGTRYHCNECGDFDLCGNCFLRVGHYHDLEPLEPKGNRKASEIINILKSGNLNTSGLRSSIRKSTTVSTISNKSCKSWIR